MKERRIAYPEDLIKAAVGYLVQRPFAEVAGLVDGFQRGVQVEIDLPEQTQATTEKEQQ